MTIDAIGCQTEIAETIIEQDADYVLSLKENQGRLYEDVKLLLDDLESSAYRAYTDDHARTVDKGHGRLEIRECWTISDPEVLRHLRGFENWSNLRTVPRIRAERRIGDETSCEDRYPIASVCGAKLILSAVRFHSPMKRGTLWGIENQLHWVLDIAFDEDRHRLPKEHGPENFALLRHIALNLLKQEQSLKRSIKGKRLVAGWNEDYLLKVLAGFTSLV